MSEYKKQIGVLVDAFVTQVSELARKELLGAIETLAPQRYPIHRGSSEAQIYADKQTISQNVFKPAEQAAATMKKLVKKIKKSMRKAIVKAVKKIERTVKDGARQRRLDAKKAYRLRMKVKKGVALNADQTAWLVKHAVHNLKDSKTVTFD